MKINGDNERIKVSASGEYDVVIGNNLLDNSGEYIKEVLPLCTLALITDDTVDSLYSKRVITSLERAGYKTVKFVFPHGEQSKNFSTYEKILNFLSKNELTRSDAIVALGGGVVGDISGFAAATFLRGIKYVQIPTTLLAQIDSSVGGKTAIDLPSGKNLVGAFKQPSLVICDVDTLKTLPEDIYLDGMGEVAKYAVLDKKVYDLISKVEYDIKDLVYLCIDYKRKIVEADEFENGVRKLLNLGHTVAHGVELLSSYTVPHGKAVRIGLDIILLSSYKHGYIDKECYDKIMKALLICSPSFECEYSVKDIANVALFDKKRSGDYITVVAVYGVGDCRQVKIKATELAEYLK